MRAGRTAIIALQTLRGVGIIYVATILSIGVLMSLIEGWSLVDSIWWALVTASTVGYGDIAPADLSGRIVATFLIHFGPLFITPLATAIIASMLLHDHDAFTHEEQELMKANQAEMRANQEQIMKLLQERNQ